MLPLAWHVGGMAKVESREYLLERPTGIQGRAGTRNSEEKKAHGDLRSFQRPAWGRETRNWGLQKMRELHGLHGSTHPEGKNPG